MYWGAKMAEKDMRKNLCNQLRLLDAQAMENRVGPGTPDVSYIGGWIECKWLRAWPKRPGTVVTLDHPLLKSQRVWLKRHFQRGGTAFVMLQCGREWLLFNVMTAREFLGASTQAELYRHAIRIWKTGLKEEELITFLIEQRPVRRLNAGELREARWKAAGGSW